MNNLLHSIQQQILKQSISKSKNIIRKAHTVRVILIQDIPENNQYAGETHHVKAGYARNYLIPKKYALYASQENFVRVGIVDPDIPKEETIEERLAREKADDEDVKAADFLRYYLRNKTLKIWRNIDVVNITGSGMSFENAPIFPGKVNHLNVRDKLSKQLRIDLDDHEKVQIHPEPVSFALFDEDETAMQELLDKMEPLVKEGDDEGQSSSGGECKVELKNLGEYLVKIHLKGDQSVGLRLAVMKR